VSPRALGRDGALRVPSRLRASGNVIFILDKGILNYIELSELLNFQLSYNDKTDCFVLVTIYS
jgi:hypothetical protein